MKPLTREIEFNHIFRDGMVRQAVVQQRMAGRIITQWPWDGGVLAYFIAQTIGDHIEIGCAWGGTAILAMMTKSSGHVYTIDPCIFCDGPQRIDPNVIRINFAKFGLADHITLYVQSHPPLPIELEDKRFATAFIDGSHTYEDALADWLNLKDRVDEFILFHDVSADSVKKVFKMAKEDSDWELAYEYEHMGVVRRV